LASATIPADKVSPPSPELSRALAWERFIKFCEGLRFGRIEKLEIQNGLPIIAEKVTEKYKFS
jgi:hypothetical protein